MATFSQREQARQVIFTSNHNKGVDDSNFITKLKRYTDEEVQSARQILEEPLHFREIFRAIQDAEAQCELGFSELTVAQTVDKDVRGHGIKLVYEVDFKSQVHRISCGDKVGRWANINRYCQVYDFMAFRKQGEIVTYRIFDADLIEVKVSEFSDKR